MPVPVAGERLRQNLKQWRHSQAPLKRWTHSALRRGWAILRFLIDGRYRSEKLITWKSGTDIHQRSTFTIPDRYPLLFRQAQSYFDGKGLQPKLLSFGCSTGEEVFTLGRYLPEAGIVGVDINPWCLRQCRKKNPEPRRYAFFHRFSQEFESSGEFDAVFCLAVFQRTENRTGRDNRRSIGYTFEQFEQEVRMLDGKLKEGGLFVIDHSDFSFTDTACSRNYIPLPFEKNRFPRQRPLFDRDNQKVADAQNNFRMFVKQGGKGSHE
jgi:hypothetical protein